MSAELTVMLLRHAHAEPASDSQQGDLERALSLRGIEEADAAAAWLAGHEPPLRALSSSAQRARQTLQCVLASMGGALQAQIEPRIYEASLADLLDVIEAHRDAGRLLLVGHNPGLESLVALLSTGQSGDHRGMPPAGLAMLHFPAGSAIEPGAAQLTAFWSP
jgi:phosphohistidine phosphatase SixA